MASPFDLVTLADLKSWLGITGIDDDVLLARLITQISRAIFGVIDRPAILPSAYTETRDGGKTFRSCSGNGRSRECLLVSWTAWQSLLRRRLSVARVRRLAMF